MGRGMAAGTVYLCHDVFPSSAADICSRSIGGKMMQPQLLGQQGRDQERSHIHGGQPDWLWGTQVFPRPVLALLFLGLQGSAWLSPIRYHCLSLSGKGSRIIRATG